MRFPGVRLADNHSCIAYSLNHQEEVDKYLADREQSAGDLRERITCDPVQQQGSANAPSDSSLKLGVLFPQLRLTSLP